MVDESDADSLAESVLSDGQSVLVSEDGKKVKAKSRTGFGFKLAGAVKSAATFTEEVRSRSLPLHSVPSGS